MSYSGKQRQVYRKRFVMGMQQIFAHYDGLQANEKLISTSVYAG